MWTTLNVAQAAAEKRCGTVLFARFLPSFGDLLDPLSSAFSLLHVRFCQLLADHNLNLALTSNDPSIFYACATYFIQLH